MTYDEILIIPHKRKYQESNNCTMMYFYEMIGVLSRYLKKGIPEVFLGLAKRVTISVVRIKLIEDSQPKRNKGNKRRY